MFMEYIFVQLSDSLQSKLVFLAPHSNIQALQRGLCPGRAGNSHLSVPGCVVSQGEDLVRSQWEVAHGNRAQQD